MSVFGKSVTIIGAGIGGLTVARALAQRGAKVTVLEQAPEITEVGAGLQISPNGFRVLDALGLGTAIKERSVQGQMVNLRDYRGASVLELDLRQSADQRYYFVHRADLIDILAEGARDVGVKIKLSNRVASVSITKKPRVVLKDSGEIESDMVIGADGIHSKLRPELNGKDAPFFTGQVAWRAVVPNVVGRGAQAVVHMGPGRHLVSYPLRGGEFVNLVAVQERKEWAQEGWMVRDDPKNLRAIFSDFGGDAAALLSQVKDVHIWGLFRHPVAKTWAQGATALLGDAAHPTLPFLAQGAVMAIEDAWILADAVDNAEFIEDGLRHYQERRIARVTKVINTASKNAWKYHLSARPFRGAAHMALRVGGAVAPRRMLGQFDWIYGYDATA